MKKEKMFKNSVEWLILGLLSSFFAHFILEIIINDFDLLIVVREGILNKSMLFLLGTFIIFVIYTLLSSILGSSIMGSISVISISILVGIATSLKDNFRGEPVYPNDIYWLRELRFLFEMVGYRNTFVIIIILLLTTVSLILLYRYTVKPLTDSDFKNKKTVARIAGITISFILLFYIGRFNYIDNLTKKIYSENVSWISWNQPENYQENGFVAGFLYNLDAPPMEAPENYSKEKIEELFKKYKDISIEINNNKEEAILDTNVIFIMNESFSDPLNLEGVESNEDPLPNFRKISHKSLSGTLLVPGYGGGTATNEFQVLTGISLEPLSPHVTSPFIQMTQKMNKFPSISNKMKENGYTTTAIHAFSPTYYRRRDVYQGLSFENFIHQENMKYTDTPDVNHPYISDVSIYREMLDVMEETEKVDFLHLVTMQNHSGYRDNYKEHSFDVSGTGDYGSAVGYFQDLKVSDEALKELIDRLDEYPEPVLVVFWGDHLPGFYKENITNKNSVIKLHETPFFIYSNDMEVDGDIGMRSLIYVHNYLVRILNLDVSPFDSMLLQLEKRLPIVDKRLYYDTILSEDLQLRNDLSEESRVLLDEYSLIIYDITTGKNYANEIGFFDYFN